MNHANSYIKCDNSYMEFSSHYSPLISSYPKSISNFYIILINPIKNIPIISNYQIQYFMTSSN